MKRSLATIILGALTFLPSAQFAAAQNVRTTTPNTIVRNAGLNSANTPLRNRATNSTNTTSNGSQRVVIPVRTNRGSTKAKKTCSCGCGGTPRPFCAYKDCSCAK